MKYLAILAIVTITSCSPEPCVDTYKYTHSDGTVEWMEVEYDCSQDVYYY